MKGIDFVPLRCNMFGQKHMDMGTLRTAIYYVKRFNECCDNRTYYEHHDNMDACIKNMKDMIKRMEETND